jgi:hypothetical protein
MSPSSTQALSETELDTLVEFLGNLSRRCGAMRLVRVGPGRSLKGAVGIGDSASRSR